MKLKINKKTIGISTTLLGFCLILLNAVSFLFQWDISAPSLLIIGVTFFLFGGFISNKQIANEINHTY